MLCDFLYERVLMKTYKYSKLSFFVQLFSILALIAALLFLEYKYNYARFLNRTIFLALFLVICIPFAVSVFNRKIIIKDEDAVFISFFNSAYTSKAERNFAIKYTDIKSIEIKKSFIPQLMSLKLTAKNRSKAVFIEYNFKNHKELYKDLCDSVKSNNPEAFIDEKIYSYCQIQK